MGTFAVGGGFAGAQGSVTLSGPQGGSPATGWQVAGAEGVTAYAVCAP
nr:hypothetical protein [Streptomyces sp. TLI_235]